MVRNFADALNIQNQLPNGYGQKARNEAINLKIKDSAIKRKDLEWITIDAKESKDLDDGIWLEKYEQGYKLEVSIADATELIPIFSALDIEAMKKTTSIYLPTHIVHMFPPRISTDLASLNHNQKRFTLTVEIDFDLDGIIKKFDIYESSFYNQNRFHYDTFTESYINRDHDYHILLHNMSELAQKLYMHREKKWALKFNESDRKISQENKTHIAHFIIQEFMICANRCISKFLIEKKINAIHRNHMPDFKHKHIPLRDIERAYYGSEMKYHKWLEESFYTHFTSPIRRLCDLIVHRQIKAFLRNDEIPYTQEDLSFLSTHINTQRSVIEILWRNHIYHTKITKLVRKTKKQINKIKSRHKVLKTYYLKDNIRLWVKKQFKLPKEVRAHIIEDIKNGTDKTSWSWSLWVFLISMETEIIQTLKNKVMEMEEKRYKKFLNIIWQTIIAKKREKIIQISEHTPNKNTFSIKVKYMWEIILDKKGNTHDNNINIVKCRVRKEVLGGIFDYFLKYSSSMNINSSNTWSHSRFL